MHKLDPVIFVQRSTHTVSSKLIYHSEFIVKKSIMSAATILTAETVPQYLADNSEKIGVFAKDAKITAKAILGGNVNYAFCATEESSGRTIFVKQAPEFVAVFGPDGLPLTSARMKQEIAVFEEWKGLLGEEDCSKYLPTIYLFDSELLVMCDVTLFLRLNVWTFLIRIETSPIDKTVPFSSYIEIAKSMCSKNDGIRHGIP